MPPLHLVVTWDSGISFQINKDVLVINFKLVDQKTLDVISRNYSGFHLAKGAICNREFINR